MKQALFLLLTFVVFTYATEIWLPYVLPAFVPNVAVTTTEEYRFSFSVQNPASVLYPPPAYPPIVLVTNGSGVANRFTVYAVENYVDIPRTDVVRLTYPGANEFTVATITFVSTSGASISGYTCGARFSTSA
ncbi:MAG: hypothetical protein QW680_13850, partial [Pyrobaculum sp.]